MRKDDDDIDKRPQAVYISLSRFDRIKEVESHAAAYLITRIERAVVGDTDYAYRNSSRKSDEIGRGNIHEPFVAFGIEKVVRSEHREAA